MNENAIKKIKIFVIAFIISLIIFNLILYLTKNLNVSIFVSMANLLALLAITEFLYNIIIKKYSSYDIYNLLIFFTLFILSNSFILGKYSNVNKVLLFTIIIIFSVILFILRLFEDKVYKFLDSFLDSKAV